MILKGIYASISGNVTILLWHLIYPPLYYQHSSDRVQEELVHHVLDGKAWVHGLFVGGESIAVHALTFGL